MRRYQALDWFDIKGRGRVASVSNDEAFERDAAHLIGEVVEIDGAQYKVLGVESWALQTIRKGAPIGLLVERIDVPAWLYGEAFQVEHNPNCLSPFLVRLVDRDRIGYGKTLWEAAEAARKATAGEAKP